MVCSSKIYVFLFRYTPKKGSYIIHSQNLKKQNQYVPLCFQYSMNVNIRYERDKCVIPRDIPRHSSSSTAKWNGIIPKECFKCFETKQNKTISTIFNVDNNKLTPDDIKIPSTMG